MLNAEDVSNQLQREGPMPIEGGLFRAHFEQLPGPAYIWRRVGEDFELIAHNRAALDLADGDVRDLIGARASTLFASRQDIIDGIRQCADTRSITVREADVTFVSGVTRRMLTTRIPLSADIVVSHAEDVTDRRAFEDRLAASERRFHALFKTHPDLVFRMDVHGNYLDLHVPDGAVLPLKLKAEELVGRNIADLFGPAAAVRHRRYALEAIRTGEMQVIEYDVQLGDREIQVESRVVKSGDEEVVVNIRDITKRVELEQAIIDAQENERARLGRMLQKHRAQLQTRHTALVDAVLPPGESDLAAARAALETAARELNEIMDDLAALPEGTTVLAALKTLASRSEQSLGIRCRLTHGESVPEMLAQTSDLYRFAQEAIGCAVHRGSAKNIEMICSTINSQFVLSIIDDGQDNAWAADEDAGYGMRIMRYLAKRLGGKLTRSRRGSRGTTVTCSCPTGKPLSLTERLRALVSA
jgi:PAS domain S-box-containing protein